MYKFANQYFNDDNFMLSAIGQTPINCGPQLKFIIRVDVDCKSIIMHLNYYRRARWDFSLGEINVQEGCLSFDAVFPSFFLAANPPLDLQM